MKKILIPLFALVIGLAIGARKPAETLTVTEYVPVRDTLSDWQLLQMGIAMTESRFDPSVTGSCQDGGIYQITPIYVREANRLSGQHYTHEDTYDIAKSLEMFAIVQDYYNPSHSEEEAIRRHNPGGAGWYAARVKENLEFVKRYEAVRAALIEK